MIGVGNDNDGDRLHSVNVFYKCEKVLPNGRIETEEYPLKDLHFPTSVMRAIYHYSTTREASKLTYDLKHPNGSWGNYVSLRKLVAYLSKTFRFHTKHTELRQTLTEFASKTGQYMRESPDGSGTLVAMRVYLDGTSMETMEQFSQTHPGDIVVALGAKGRYFHNRFLENDIGLIDFDDSMMSQFKEHTGQEFRPNSCLASAMLYICFVGKGRPVWIEAKNWDRLQRTKKPMKSTSIRIPTYEIISEICGVEFQADGSLQMSLHQLVPFLEKYGVVCQVMTTSNRKFFEYIPANPRSIMPRLRLVLHHRHV